MMGGGVWSGIKKLRGRLAFWAALVAGSCMLHLNIVDTIRAAAQEELSISVLDLVYLLFRGEPLLIGEGMQVIPFQWLSLCGCLLFVTCSYSCGDISDSGYRTLVYSGTRGKWWVSKTVFVHIITAILFCMVVGIAAATVWITGERRFPLLAEFGDAGLLEPLARASLGTQIVWLLLLPCMAFCVMASVQNALAVLFGPTAAFFAAMAAFLASVNTISPFLFPTVTMALRAVTLYEAGVPPEMLLCLMFVCDIAVNGTGYLVFRKKDCMEAQYLEVEQ